MKHFLIKLIFRLLDGWKTSKTIDEDRMRKWLADVYWRKEFQDYITKRDMEILQAMGIGVTREDYIRLVGQRIELGRLLSTAKRESDKEDSKRQERTKVGKKVK